MNDYQEHKKNIMIMERNTAMEKDWRRTSAMEKGNGERRSPPPPLEMVKNEWRMERKSGSWKKKVGDERKRNWWGNVTVGRMTFTLLNVIFSLSQHTAQCSFHEAECIIQIYIISYINIYKILKFIIILKSRSVGSVWIRFSWI